MGNKHHSIHNAQHNHPPSNGVRPVLGKPLQPQTGEHQYTEARGPGPAIPRNDVESGNRKSVSHHEDHEPPSTPRARDGQRSFSDTVLHAVQEHPLPFALVGLGLGVGATWLVMSKRAQSSNSTSRWVGEVLQRAGTRTRGLEQNLEQLLPTSPLAIGAAVVTLATGITLAVLGKRAETSWLGQRREQLSEMAEGLAQDAVARVGVLAKQLIQSF